MKIKFPIGILGAGLGSRMKERAVAKPLAKIGEHRLLDLLLKRFQDVGAPKIVCALRAELLDSKLRTSLPTLPGLCYLFVDTESSLHTLAELIREFRPGASPVLFTMADTVMLPEDFESFLGFCSRLGPEENAVLLTRFIDDEKPLWAHLNERGYVSSFGTQASAQITSGMYFLQPDAMQLALKLVDGGVHKMRNFLSHMAENGFPIKSFVVQKTIDVDHPTDLEEATLFLQRD